MGQPNPSRETKISDAGGEFMMSAILQYLNIVNHEIP